jgi:putative ATPase
MDFATPSHISDDNPDDNAGGGLALKRQKIGNVFQNELPLAARIRPKTLDEVCGQELIGPTGVLRELIMQDRIPSMVLWGGPGTGKTTIARVIASMTKSRFIEMNSTNFGVAECKKVFSEVYINIVLVFQRFIDTYLRSCRLEVNRG